ncbi:MAG: prepilin-type N-terminal cleavage/methylation domain-containing protein [Planctomycetes bacterium]|nr:prepilin-type N-terminal cleavage/methylation domain-containing protein [Planctomycetota bacterium]NOG53956.1 prepilin-type N-terminal cleavage/methylation domain-containing protein [Planctomycetota bacterium]
MQMAEIHSGNRHRHAFTLIELLVVISIIALLIGILLPALSRARQAAQGTACTSNIRQLNLAHLNYANEYGKLAGTATHDEGLDWIGFNNEPDYQKREVPYNGLIWPYLKSEFAFECPTEKRKANDLFSYTMPHALGGARVELNWPTFFRTEPERGYSSPLELVPGLPVIVEEDEYFSNNSVQDGAWANNDQITERHMKRGNIGFMDGSCRIIETGKGSDPERRETQDFEAWDVVFKCKNKDFVMGRYTTEFGWINNPH